MRRLTLTGKSCWFRVLLVAFVFATVAAAQTGFPFTNEDLNYTVNWPSGLSLGEAHFHAKKAENGWKFELTLDAGLPGFPVSDRYQATSTGGLCSLEFERSVLHGRRKANEKITFDYQRGTAQRVTIKGGSSEIPIQTCARDALTFLYYTRRELGQGRVPPPETIFAGASYQIRLEYTGAQKVSVNDVPTESDRILATVKGPKSDVSFEMFFARDAARTPLIIRVPFSLGTFSMELVR